MSIQVFGIQVSRGVAIGRAVLVASSRVDVAHYYIGADQVGPEIERLRLAKRNLHREVKKCSRADTASFRAKPGRCPTIDLQQKAR